MTVQNQFVPLKRVTVYCDGCKTSFTVDLPKNKEVSYCPVCGGCGISIENIKWLEE